MKQTIDGHNKSTLCIEADKLKNKVCNCRKPKERPNSLIKSAVYQATVFTSDNKQDEKYVGQTEHPSKLGTITIKPLSETRPQVTVRELSKYVWEPTEIYTNYKIMNRLNHTTLLPSDVTYACDKNIS